MPIQNAVARLRQFSLFADLEPADIEVHINDLVEERVAPPGEILFRQGDAPSSFYLIEEGEVLETGQDAAGNVTWMRRAEAKDILGRRPLVDNVPYRATANVQKRARLLQIDHRGFRILLGLFPVLRDRLRLVNVVNRLLAIPVFAGFTTKELPDIADLVREVRYSSGDVIFRQGQEPEAFYVIDVGEVRESATGVVSGRQTWPKYLAAGSCFGRYSLLKKTLRRATAEAMSEVRLFQFSADTFGWLCTTYPHFAKALKRPDLLRHLGNLAAFASLSSDEQKQLLGFVGLAHVRQDDVLFRQGEVDPTLYVLYEGGAVQRSRDLQGRERPCGYVKVGQTAGTPAEDYALFPAGPRPMTVVATSPTHWLYLTEQDLSSFRARYPAAGAKLHLGQPAGARRQRPRFSWLEPGEQILLFSRRHPFFLAWRLVPPFFALLAAIVLAVLPIPALIGWLALAAALGWVAWRVIDWSNDFYLVTTSRVAHREKVVLLRERRDETPLDKIQNVNSERNLLGRIFGFGSLLMDTAAATATGVVRVTFTYVARLEETQTLIMDRVTHYRAGEHLESRRAIRGRLEATLGASIRATIARPAVPAPPVSPAIAAAGGVLGSLKGLRLRNPLWIERRTPDSITWRKHWIRLLELTWLPSLIIVALLVLLFGVRSLPGLAVLVLVASLLGVGGWWLWNAIDWGNDLYIVTPDRVIDTEKKPFGFRFRKTETTFDKIQNVSFDIPDPVAMLLGYGMVFIYTAGAQGRLDFSYVPDPRSVQAEISHRLTEFQAAQRRKQREAEEAELPLWFSEYDGLFRSPP